MLGGIFHFHKVLIENMQANSGDPYQTPYFVAPDLGLHYLPVSHKKDARHIWINKCNYSHKSCRNLGSILLK